MALGCLGVALANLLMVAAATTSATHGNAAVSATWLLGYFVIVTLGELYLSPTGLSLVTKVAPARYLSMTMGVWLATSFLGNPTDIYRPDGIQVVQSSSTGSGLKFINLVIHDARQGISYWKEAVDSEINGCLIYYNGWQGTDRGHGHGIYTQNHTGTKKMIDNIIFSSSAEASRPTAPRAPISTTSGSRATRASRTARSRP